MNTYHQSHVAIARILLFFVVSRALILWIFFPTAVQASVAHTPPPPTLNSNVIFIPGIEASRLYMNGSQIWEPQVSNIIVSYIRNLYLNSSGNSISSITTRDIINHGPGYDVYNGFITYMNSLVAAGTIQTWEPFPYDWRMDVRDVVANPVQLSDGTSYSMISELVRLASSSPTGKVTIIAHSNGGLVVKALVAQLIASGRPDLVAKIDKVILVAVPQLGTPFAIPALLHGYGQSIFAGLVLSASTARTLADNMPDAYDLMPSKAYFKAFPGPVITFDSSIPNSTGFRKYGSSITDITTLNSFLLSTKDHRSQPDVLDTVDPTILNPILIASAATTHDLLDTFQFPDSIHVYQIAGTGLDTLEGFAYAMVDTCVPGTLCFEEIPTLDEIPLTNTFGDGTVLSKSATILNTDTDYINLDEYNKEQNQNISHQNILEIPDVDQLVKDIVTNSTRTYPSFISTQVPNSNGVGTRIQYGIHSPATLDAYDAKGDHAGLIATTNDSDPDVQQIEENIPNSYYMQFGEGKYIGIDADSESTIKIQGTGIGTFTLDVDTTAGTTTIEHEEFADVPVTPATTATIMHVQSATSTIPELIVDEDGDGTVDATILPNQPFDPLLYLQTMRKTIVGMNLDPKIQKDLLQKIDRMTTLIQQDKTKQLTVKLKRLIKNVDYQKRLSKMSDADKQDFVNMLLGLLDGMQN